MPTFEHTVTFIPVDYQSVHEGRWLFRRESPLPVRPDIEAFLQTAHAPDMLANMGRQGWELVSVQVLLRGLHSSPTGSEAGGSSVGYALTAGFCCFWQRTCGTDC